MPSLGLDGPEEEGKPIKIAVITFAFDNSKVIKWLRERGNYIKNEQWDKLERINNDIKTAIKRDGTLLDKLQRPCSVFATFESEEGYNRALLYNNVIETLPEFGKYKMFLGQDIEI